MMIILDDSTSAKGGQYVCAICMAAFYKPYVLKYHLRLHSGHYPFICRVCGQGSTRVENLIHHQKLHPGFKVCRKCGQSFDEAEFKGHTCIELRPYVCQNCGYGFVRLGMLNAHSRECKDFSCYSPTLREYQYHFKGSYYCHSCNLSFSQLHVLIKHKIKNHADHVPSLYCERGAVVPKEEVLKDKYIFYDLVDKASYKCYFCGEVCPTKVSHDRHVQKCHSIISSFSCKFCDRNFNFKGDLKEHMTRKHPFRMARDHPHKCSTCGMYCITAKQLERHRVTCNAGQIAPTALTSSSGTPSVQDKLQLDLSCRDCKQKFATKFSLKRHMKSRHSTNGSSVVGSSDRPKSVVKDDNSEEQCDAPFAAVDLTEEVFLVVSDNSSDDESPSKKTEELTCSVCEKSFLYKGHLYRHMQRQHNTTDLSYKRYKCGACHKMFFGTDRKSARNHWHKEHSGALNIVEIPPIGASVPVTPKAKGPVIATKVLPPALPKAKGPVIATKVLPPASPKAKGPVIATKVLPPASPKAKGPVIATKVLPLASPKAKGPVSVIATKVLPTKSPDDKILTPVKNKSSKKAGNSDKKFACRVCMKSFWDISEQQNHMIVAHKYIRCKHCQLVFRDASSRNRHIRKFHPSKEAISKKEAASQSRAKSKHAKEKAFDEADKWFKSDTSPPTLPQAKAHVRIIANSAESSLPTTSEGNTEEETTTHLYACSICGREYKIYGCLVNHLEKAHDCPSESLSTVSTHTAMGTSYM